ncbi:MAG: polysaccharide pyruvyl transferase [Roseovarius sp.]|jgi:polysaccharide pyruvyl transferase WcaK-like protein|nr:polysaccharide pyruvyl transferase [Roseovarius sp.]MBK43753.1 polysaccharide pyruvyl transferase [Roseovarius sp.]MBK43804.1 polysaccharide pyruvyl transferase [Roseovarius sp.]|tara:strand:+ start:4181 stop:5374 length:1194 start_codon:yes stop_codon:yes gene_type:complete
MLKIALIFHSASNDNLGVGALSVSEVAILRRIAGARGLSLAITVIDSIAERPPYVTGEDITIRPTRPLRKPRDFFRAVRAADLVIDIGGGDSFADIYGPRRLAQMLLMKYLTHLARRPLVLAPQTFGPFRHGLSTRLARQTIRRCAIITTRDSLSTACLREMGITGEIIEASDVALRLPYDPPSERPEGGAVRVGINVSGLLMSGGYTRNNMFGLRMDYPQLIRDLLRRFTDHPDGCEIHLVPHVISWAGGGVEDDHAASLALREEFPSVTVAPAFTSPSEAKSYIAGLDFFMGARMHACIAAFSSGVPVVPMAYSRKFAGLFGSLGYDETVDCTSLSAEEILARIFDAYGRRADLARTQKAALATGLEKLARYEAALGDLMEQLALRPEKPRARLP